MIVASFPVDRPQTIEVEGSSIWDSHGNSDPPGTLYRFAERLSTWAIIRHQFCADLIRCPPSAAAVVFWHTGVLDGAVLPIRATAIWGSSHSGEIAMFARSGLWGCM